MTYWNDDGTTRYWKRCDDHKVKVRKDGVQTRGCRCCGSWEGPGLVPVAEGAIIIEDPEGLRAEIAAAITAVTWRPGYGEAEFTDVPRTIDVAATAERIMTALGRAAAEEKP